MLFFVTLLGVRHGLVRTKLPRQACRFVYYYNAAGKSEMSGNLWERITYSLMLATSQPPA